MVVWRGSDSFGIRIHFLCGSLRLRAHDAIRPKSFFKLDSLPSFLTDSTGIGLPLTMTPLDKSNLRLVLILIASCVLMTGYWIYFIIAKDPIRP